MSSIIESIRVARLHGRTRINAQPREVMNMHHFPHTMEEYACHDSSNEAKYYLCNTLQKEKKIGVLGIL